MIDDLREYVPSPKQMLWGVLGAFVLLVVFVVVAYSLTRIPNPNDTATNQQNFFLYSDGKILAHGGQVNRITVKLDQVPKPVQYASRIAWVWTIPLGSPVVPLE